MDDRSSSSSFAPSMYSGTKFRAMDSPMRGSTRSLSPPPGINGSVSSFSEFRGGHVPESNTVISAMIGLQEKIRKLELERSQAESNLRSLAKETSQYKETLQKEHSVSEATQDHLSRNNKELESQLESAESKCNLLEKQLEYMRQMVQSAEMDRNNAIQRSTILAQQTAQQASEEIKQQLEKLTGLERDHVRLTATQTLAEKDVNHPPTLTPGLILDMQERSLNKIKTLEEKLRSEQKHRKQLQNKQAELQTAAETNRILMTMSSPPKDSKPPKRRKKRVHSAPVGRHGQLGAGETKSHYHLNMGSLPFVVGKSTAKSHSVGANIQQVLSMMKGHNPTLCKAANKVQRRYSAQSTSSSDSETGLEELLVGLQNEFGHMSFEHQELVKQINEEEDARIREDLERELDGLVTRMESKGEQIALVKKHRDQVTKKKKATVKRKSRKVTRSATVSTRGGDVQVVTTVKSQGRQVNVNQTRGCRTAQDNLKILRGMRNLQTSLRKDDLSWD